MNNVMNMDPWCFLDDILDTGSRTLRSIRARAAGRFPPVNVYIADKAIMIDMELPGKTANDVNLSVEPQAVVVSDRPPVTLGDDGNAVENRPSTWTRRLELPFRVDVDGTSARFANGILRIELPKSEAASARKIAIQ